MLYAVVPAGAESLPDDLHQFTVADVGVVYEERDTVPSTGRDEVVQFGKTIVKLAEEHPVLPMRYGTLAEDQLEIQQLIEERQTDWRARLRVVAGHVEMLVHLDIQPIEPLPQPASGRDYLMAKAAASRSRLQLIDEVRQSLGELVRETRVLDDGATLRLACLVDRSALSDFQAAVQGAVCTGPWPPFSFSEEAPP